MTRLPERAPISVGADNLILRAWSPADAPQVASACMDALIALWNPLTGPAAEWCAARADWSEGTHASWAIAATTDPSCVLGSISLFHLDREQETAEVGFWISPQHRGKGAASTALRSATEFAFVVLGLRRVVLFHAVENLGSCRTASAAGFELEGLHRESHRHGDGRWHDEHTHARLHATRHRTRRRRHDRAAPTGGGVLPA